MRWDEGITSIHPEIYFWANDARGLFYRTTPDAEEIPSKLYIDYPRFSIARRTFSTCLGASISLKSRIALAKLS